MKEKMLNKKISRKDFLRYNSILFLGGILDSAIKFFRRAVGNKNAYGNIIYGGIKK